jgi:ribosomal protein L40E
VAGVICMMCGLVNEPGAEKCAQCGVHLDTPTLVTRVVPRAPGPEPPPGPEPDPRGPHRTVTCSCGTENPLGSEVCWRCQRPLAGTVVRHAAHVVLPGSVVVPLRAGMPLQLGRHSDEPTVAAALGRYDSVSRTHCWVSVDNGLVRVREDAREPSTNGTFVGGSRVTDLTVPLGAGVRIGLGKELQVDVLPASGARP